MKKKANHCAISVPKATPAMLILKKNTKIVLATILIIFCKMEIIMGKRVGCIPINQPVKAYKPNIAGVPHIHIFR